MSNIRERLDKILPEIKKESFMENKGLGNEIGFYIFDYDAKDEMLVRDHIEFLKRKINNSTGKVEIIEFDLYNIMLEILEEKGYLERTIKMEEKKGSEKILKAVKKTLRLTSKNNLFVKYINERVEDDHIVFITGVGKAWPIVRSHTVLNNLHAVIDGNPLIMFFPGSYDGAQLKLFGEIHDDNYYRAFTLVPR
ncbi:DUF1788 domain-containing protein [Natronospora cellulosivora (SeqCode)]